MATPQGTGCGLMNGPNATWTWNYKYGVRVEKGLSSFRQSYSRSKSTLCMMGSVSAFVNLFLIVTLRSLHYLCWINKQSYQISAIGIQLNYCAFKFKFQVVWNLNCILFKFDLFQWNCFFKSEYKIRFIRLAILSTYEYTNERTYLILMILMNPCSYLSWIPRNCELFFKFN